MIDERLERHPKLGKRTRPKGSLLTFCELSKMIALGMIAK